MLKLSRRTDYLKLPETIKRVILLGDPHGDLEALKQVLALESNENTTFISVGDNIGYQDGPTSSQFVEYLIEKKIPSVYGNHEEWMRPDKRLFLPSNWPNELTDLAFEWCKNLPLKIRIQSSLASHYTFTVQHSITDGCGDWDWLSHNNLKAFFKQVGGNVVLTGHSHQPQVHIMGSLGSLVDVPHTIPFDEIDKFENGLKLKSHNKYVLDAGSLSRASHVPAGHGSYGILDLEHQTLGLKSFKRDN